MQALAIILMMMMQQTPTYSSTPTVLKMLAMATAMLIAHLRPAG